MPITVFDIKGVPGTRRERIEAAVVAGGRHTRGPHEAWIAADPFKGGFRVLITGPQGFERTVVFALDDDPAVIAERVRETWTSKASGAMPSNMQWHTDAVVLIGHGRSSSVFYEEGGCGEHVRSIASAELGHSWRLGSVSCRSGGGTLPVYLSCSQPRRAWLRSMKASPAERMMSATSRMGRFISS
jgi:hypothetical protein